MSVQPSSILISYNVYLRMTLDRKKALGAYYTSYEVAKVLTDWAIRRSDELVLEPSFGACKFLTASFDRLQSLGSTTPLQYLYGVDIDQCAFYKYLVEEFDLDENIDHFICSDFFAIERTTFETAFDVIVGNPPYVSYHNLSNEERIICREKCSEFGFKLNGKFSLWLPFTIHAISLLKEDGRLALVLPTSLVEADYAKTFIDFLSKNFDETTIIKVRNRLFKSSGTNEKSAILLCEGYRSQFNPKSITYLIARDQKEVKGILANRANNTCKNVSDNNKVYFSELGYYPGLDELLSKFNTVQLGELFNVKIGLVTGHNKFFIVNKDDIIINQLPCDQVHYVISKKHHYNTNNITTSGLNELYDMNEYVCLFTTVGTDYNREETQNYLSLVEEEYIQNSKTFKKRAVWHSINTEKTPTAFLKYMSNSGPVLIKNSAKVTSTNNLHRLYCKSKLTSDDIKFTSVALQSSLSQLVSELTGKSYGSGILKMEPSTTKLIPIFNPSAYAFDKLELDKAFRKIGNCLKGGDWFGAVHIADCFFEVVTKRKYSLFTMPLLHECRENRLSHG